MLIRVQNQDGLNNETRQFHNIKYTLALNKNTSDITTKM